MEDYSEYTSTFPKRIAELTNLLNDRKWTEARSLADEMSKELMIVSEIAWSNENSED